MPYLLALDQGTTSSRAIVFDEDGAIRGVAQKEFEQIFPQPGWVEHDPTDIWSSQLAVAVEAVADAGVGRGDIAGIGITNQRETTIVWDRKTGRPIYNAIVWQDRRTAGFCDHLRESGKEEQLRERTGLLADPYFAGTKIRWILENVEGARERAQRGELAFGTVDTWLVWKATEGAVHATDATNASRTLLYNIHTGEWDDDLLALLEVPREMLPEVRDSSGPFGEAAAHPGVAGVPILGIAGDQQAALVGQSCFQRGMAKNTYGTGAFLVLNTGEEPIQSRHNMLTTVGWSLHGRRTYALEGSIFIAGAVVQWLRDGLELIRHAREIEPLAASVPDAGGAYLVPAFTGLGAPYWDPYARCAMLGITRGTTRAHLARAALEAIAYQSYDVLEAMNKDSGIDLQELRVDGGACVNNLLMQFQADLLGVPVIRPKVTETTALGAAFLAGLGAGVWKDFGEISRHWEAERTFEPQASRDEMNAKLAGWRRAVERAKGWAEEE